MFARYNFKAFLCLFVIMLGVPVACAPSFGTSLMAPTSVPSAPGIPTTMPMHIPAAITPEVAIIPTALVTLTREFEPIITPLSETTSTPALTATLGVVRRDRCPTMVDSGPSLPGSILFNTGKMLDNAPTGYLDVEIPGIWAVSSSDRPPKLVNENLLRALVSPDGTMLFHVTATWESPEEAIFVDLSTGETFSFEFFPELSPFKISTWLQDGRVRYEIVTEMIEGKEENRRGYTFDPIPTYGASTTSPGEVRQVFIFDPVTKQTDQFVENLSLPEYTFYSDDIGHGIPSGYASRDPTGQFIVYTAMRNKDNVVEVRLLELQTGKVIWQQETQFIPNTTVEWDASGSKVLFQLYEPLERSNYPWSKVISLSRDGKEEGLPLQPLPETDSSLITSLTRSPNERYIFYSTVDSIGITHGFMVDTITEEIGELCGFGFDLVTSFQKEVEGLWLSDDWFVYRVLVEKGDQLIHSLLVLDVSNWTAQVLLESEPGYGINIFGWTPLEFQ